MRRLDSRARSSGKIAMQSGKGLDTGGGDGFLKAGALTTLVLQNSALALVMRYTRVSGKQADMYIPTTAVVMAEILKVAVALAMQLKTEQSVGGVIHSVLENTINQPGQYLKMGVPALLYTLQNNLAYVATSHLDGPTYQIICQSKILITAILSVVILGKALTSRQWVSLTALTCGVGFVQMSGSEAAGKVNPNTFIGFASAVSLCICSGLAGVYFELMLKQGSSTASLWMRNIQLGSFSLFLGVVMVLLKDGSEVASRGFFTGYSPMVWLCISLNSLGGLAVAMVVKYADNLVKCFATSISIVLSCILSIAFLGMTMSKGFAVGAMLVLLATYGYNTQAAIPKAGQGPGYERLTTTAGAGARVPPPLEPKESV
ncbi:unnamed protein product [Scytosiphon promiscuus]